MQNSVIYNIYKVKIYYSTTCQCDKKNNAHSNDSDIDPDRDKFEHKQVGQGLQQSV